MDIKLDPIEARVLGVLMEKDATTPDAYPLSINAIASGCNQKTNREPVMDIGEDEVQVAVDSLVKATLVKPQGSAGGRVQRYAHRLAMRLFGEYEFSAAERGLLCVLLLRGPQTPGELRSRAARLHEYSGIGEVEAVLARLASREDGPHVAELAREPGRREARWMQCFCEPPPASAPAPAATTAAPRDSDSSGDRMAMLEARLQRLETQVAHLHEALGMNADDDAP